MNDEPKRKRSIKSSTRTHLSDTASRTTKTTDAIPPPFLLAQTTNTATEPDILTKILGGIVRDSNDSIENELELPFVPSLRTESILIKKISESQEKSSKKKTKSLSSDPRRQSGASKSQSLGLYSSQVASVGAQRREELTQCMRNLYQNCFEFDETTTINATQEDLFTDEKRKQYGTDLW